MEYLLGRIFGHYKSFFTITFGGDFVQTEQKRFILHSDYAPTGDQPQAIDKLVKGFEEGNQFQTLFGVTGSGKTFTMANIIEKLNRPTLVIAHNKTLAAQLYGEFKEFFPENAVEYFVAYYKCSKRNLHLVLNGVI